MANENQNGREEGRKKFGGRKKGTPNKVTGAVRGTLSGVVCDYYDSELFKRDMASLEPKDRIDAVIKLTKYVVPQLQSTSLDVTTDTMTSLSDTLRQLAGEDD